MEPGAGLQLTECFEAIATAFVRVRHSLGRGAMSVDR